MTLDAILDDVFHGAAVAAFVEVWQETGQFPPDSEEVRRRAYAIYEEELSRRGK